MALAKYAASGTLYPPLYDGELFGGTRFMPVPIVLEAAAAKISGEYLASAKALGHVLAAALVVLTFALLRRERCPTPVALLLVSTLLVSGTGLVAAGSIRNDVLPVIVQLGAVALVARSTGRASVAGAGALCAIAVASKLSAWWGLATIVVWLLVYDRRRLAELGVSFGACSRSPSRRSRRRAGGWKDLLGLSASAVGRLGPFDVLVDRLRQSAGRDWGRSRSLILAALGTVLAARRRG